MTAQSTTQKNPRQRRQDPAIKHRVRVGAILREVLDNCRRADATQVDITTTKLRGEDWVVDVTDDGRGAGNVEPFLKARKSGWEPDTRSAYLARGLALLCCFHHCGFTVASRTGPGPGNAWTAEIGPNEIASGDVPTKRDPDDRTPAVRGTRVTFPVSCRRETLETAVQDAARDLLPMRISLDGEPLDQKPYIHEARYEEEIDGIRFAVLLDEPRTRDRDLSVQGTLLNAGLPSLHEPGGVWRVIAESDSPIPNLVVQENTRPGENRIKGNSTSQRLHSTARTILYKTMADAGASGGFRTSTIRAARELGISLEAVPCELAVWRHGRGYTPGTREIPEKDTAILIDIYENEDEDEIDEKNATLERALTVNRLGSQAFDPDDGYKNQAWYDTIPRVTHLECYARDDKSEFAPLRERTARHDRESEAPELEIRLYGPDGKVVRTLPTDLGITRTVESRYNATVILGKDSTLTVHELTTLLIEASDMGYTYENMGQDDEQEEFQTEKETEARALLEGDEQAELHDVLRIAPEILGPGLTRRLEAHPEQKLEMSFTKTTIAAALINPGTGRTITRDRTHRLRRR
ncbi:MAG: hypothetical protein OXG35_20935 [Acidobacteria bacterium]|nr:hypothetical protein [Acidobacteriota bacterium]